MADDGQIVGLTEPDSDAEKISEILKTRMEPIPEFRLRFHRTEDGKVLLILDVFKGEETPYYYSGDGTLEAFVRIGNESVRASATELKRLVLRGRNTSYDSQVTPFRVEDYAFSKLRERYKKWTGNSFDNKDLVPFGLADEGGFLTNAGALIADEMPHSLVAPVLHTLERAGQKRRQMDALDDAEYSGSVLSLIEKRRGIHQAQRPHDVAQDAQLAGGTARIRRAQLPRGACQRVGAPRLSRLRQRGPH